MDMSKADGIDVSYEFSDDADMDRLKAIMLKKGCNEWSIMGQHDRIYFKDDHLNYVASKVYATPVYAYVDLINRTLVFRVNKFDFDKNYNSVKEYKILFLDCLKSTWEGNKK